MFISHPHLDHYSLARHIRPSVLIYIGEDAHRIMQPVQRLRSGQPSIHRQYLLADDAPIRIGLFCIALYLVDHSAFDAYALFVEADLEKEFARAFRETKSILFVWTSSQKSTAW